MCSLNRLKGENCQNETLNISDAQGKVLFCTNVPVDYFASDLGFMAQRTRVCCCYFYFISLTWAYFCNRGGNDLD